MSYRRKREETHRLHKLYEQTHKHSYAFGGAWYNPRKGRYVRVTSSNRSGYPKRLRQMCNKRIRRTRNIPNGSAYKKVSEYQYLLF